MFATWFVPLIDLGQLYLAKLTGRYMMLYGLALNDEWCPGPESNRYAPYAG